MKRMKLLVFVFGFVLFFSMVSALTIVNIKTLPYQDMYITPVKTGAGFEALSTPQFFSADQSGNLKLEFEDFSVSVFEVFVSLKNSDGTTILRVKSEENFATGTEVFFTAAPEGATLVEDVNVTEPVTDDLDLNVSVGDENEIVEVNETLNESNSSVDETSGSINESSDLSGEVVGEGNSGFKVRKLIFILAGLVLLIILYLVIKEESSKGVFKDFGSRFKFNAREKKDKSPPKNRLERTKEELRNTKEKVKALEKKEKIEEVRERLDKDEEALKKLEDEQDEIIRKK
ncbi:hypothetical protein HOD29_01800 [archaeon]|jgi:hypothetical protein|nr:hypothetical protein [archaeon]